MKSIFLSIKQIKKYFSLFFWLKQKPNFPCVFICRSKIQDRYEYNLYSIEKVFDSGSYYLGWLDAMGAEIDCLSELEADQYKVLEILN